MKSSSGVSFIDQINLRVFFFLLFIYQVIFTFQGLDLSDEGFVATFYQQIFNNPQSVQYNFLFWFSGIIGGIFDYFLGGLGIWGLRLFSAIITTFSIILVYNLLKKHLNTSYLKIGIIIVLLFINNNTKVFHYNYLSVFLYLLTITFLFNGLEQKRSGKIFLAGAFIALDALTRIPSLINLGLIIVLFFHGYLNHTKLRQQLIQTCFFASGFIVSMLAMLSLMKAIGHLYIFTNSLSMLVKMGSNSNEGHYGILKLIKQFINGLVTSLKYTTFVAIFLFLCGVSVNFLKKKGLLRNWISIGLAVFFFAIIMSLVFKGILDNGTLLYIFNGLSAIAALMIIFGKGDIKLKVITLAGVFILFAYSFGSSAGMFTSGIYSFWIIFPIALDYFFRANLIEIAFSVKMNQAEMASKISVREPDYSSLKKFSLITVATICLYFSWYYPFFDYHERSNLRYSVNNKYLKMIYTTKERAAVMNELLAESSKYIQPGDYVLAYHSFPIFNYITRTVPYMRNPMPWFYNSDIFASELDSAFRNTKVLPIVIKQKRKTFGKSGGGWPDPAPFYDSTWVKENRLRDSTMNRFLEKNNYKKNWENEIFEIFRPVYLEQK